MRKKPDFLNSNFSYLLTVIAVLIILLSIQHTRAQEQPAQPVPAEAVKPQPVEEPATVNEAAAPSDQATTFASEATPATNTTDHSVIRRIVVFPIHTNGNHKKEADMAWWKVRELLADQQRFLVATKRFMEQNDVFQPRKTLVISDVVLLSKLLDSDALITSYYENRTLHMQAYAANDGQLLWRKKIEINSSRPISKQIEDLAVALTQDFLATLPYQGFQIVDPINQEPIIEEGQNLLARIDVGAKSLAKPGQKVQWLEINRHSPAPLFQGGGQYRVIAEGEVLKNENQVVTVQIKRLKDLKLLQDKALVTIPDESKRLSDAYAIRNAREISPSLTLLTEPMIDAKKANNEARPLLTALTSIANIVIAVLLAL